MPITIKPIHNTTTYRTRTQTTSNNTAPSFKSASFDEFSSARRTLKIQIRGCEIPLLLDEYPSLKDMDNNMLKKHIEPGFKNILSGFIFPVLDEHKGIDTIIPNCVMVEDPSGKVADDIINFAKSVKDMEGGMNYKHVPKQPTIPDAQRGLYYALQESLQNFEKTGKRTLIELDDFCKLVDKQAEFKVTEWMKAVTTRCADKYKATIIFKTKDSGKFIEEIIEPHRIGVNVLTKLPYVADEIEEIAPAIKETAKETGKKAETALNETKDKLTETTKNVTQKTEHIKNEAKDTIKETSKNLGKSKLFKNKKFKLGSILVAIIGIFVAGKDKIKKFFEQIGNNNKENKK